MTIAITRELFERYLRATGWERGERGFWRRGSGEIGTFDGMSQSEIDYQVCKLAQRELAAASVMGSRLGLCAAADLALSEADHARDGASAEVLIRFAVSLLRLAGVEPKNWDEARPDGSTRIPTWAVDI